MAGARPTDLTSRYQFRLDLRNAQERALAAELDALPYGQRNRLIVSMLLGPDPPDSATGIRAALREVLAEFLVPGAHPKANIPALPDELFDTTQFQ